jgi:hypothetical protein
MLVNVHASIDHKAITRILTNLRKIESQSFFSSINLSTEARAALAYLKQIFPRSRQRTTGSLRELAKYGVMSHLVEGWRSEVDSTASLLSFSLFHVFGDIDRVKTVLHSLDKGHAEYQVEGHPFMRFQSFEGVERSFRGGWNLRNWVSLRKATIPARAGAKYTEATFSYITTVLVPRIRRKVQLAVEKGMAR